MRAVRHVALLLGLAVALTWLPGVADAKGLEPDVAAAKRAQIEANLAEDPRVAIDELQDWGEELGDPELFLYAATMAHNEAESARNAELAERAAYLAATAQDIGSYLADERNYGATDWRPVTRERAAEIAREAGPLVFEAQALAQQIIDERAAADAEAQRLAALDQQKPKRELRPGTGMIAGGSAALVVGVGGIGLMAAGLSMGAANQREAESLNLPAELPRLSELDRKGATANTLAYVGGAIAGVGVIVGASLIAVGVKRRKAGGPAQAAGVHVGGYFTATGAGLSLTGSF